ncbi:hypothetical protein SAMN05444581_106102 [Methylocapsa palsarum]|uniref:Uncharacterized protein n=1 Tax=Methylocapsa palsarum TaxID=1612308 RepID=A0A1I3YQJ3_9HYPH|nr:hypothetical protein SAMN05444581_106102 [Methylocapsa palsarum]
MRDRISSESAPELCGHPEIERPQSSLLIGLRRRRFEDRNKLIELAANCVCSGRGVLWFAGSSGASGPGRRPGLSLLFRWASRRRPSVAIPGAPIRFWRIWPSRKNAANYPRAKEDDGPHYDETQCAAKNGSHEQRPNHAQAFNWIWPGGWVPLVLGQDLVFVCLPGHLASDSWQSSRVSASKSLFDRFADEPALLICDGIKTRERLRRRVGARHDGGNSLRLRHICVSDGLGC